LKKAVIIYCSFTGNTEKVAQSIQKGLELGGFDTSIRKVHEAEDICFYDYDLVCIGAPSYNWRPPKPMDDYLKNKFNYYKNEGFIKVNAPAIPGKNVLIFCTYSGPHTGIHEAVPVGKIMGQYFEHFGFNVVDEWYILSEFHGSEGNSTLGRMGNIKGLPNQEDLKRIKESAANLASRL
jgi:flavodoxin